MATRGTNQSETLSLFPNDDVTNGQIDASKNKHPSNVRAWEGKTPIPGVYEELGGGLTGIEPPDDLKKTNDTTPAPIQPEESFELEEVTPPDTRMTPEQMETNRRGIEAARRIIAAQASQRQVRMLHNNPCIKP